TELKQRELALQEAKDQAAKSIQHLKTAVITEGYTDTIACHQAGVTNVVATLGTALTRDHARILARYCERVVLMFDGDDAGQRAADRAVEIFFAEPLDVRIATLRAHTDAKDPDELLKREGGAQVLQSVFDAATDLLEYRFARVRRKLEGTGPAALAKAINEEIARLRELGLDDVEPVKRRLIVRQLAGVAGVDERTILDSIGSQIGSRRVARAAPVVEQDQGGSQGDSKGEVGPEPQESPAEHLLGCLLLRPLFAASLTGDDRELTSPAAYRSPLASSVAQAVLSAASSGESCALHSIVDSLNENGQSDAAEAAVGLAAKVQRLTDDIPERLQGHFDDCLRLARLNMGATARRSTMDLASQVKLLQKQHASLGGDSRVLPKGR
ncbi:MAG: toprim domain-containing protein, partial [Planctomycetota bacterium]